MMTFGYRKWIASLVVAAFLLSGLVGLPMTNSQSETFSGFFAGAASAQAAQRKKVKNLFQLLFDRKRKKRNRRKVKNSSKGSATRRASRKSTTRKANRTNGKNDNARRARAALPDGAAPAAGAAAAAAAGVASKRDAIPAKKENAARVLVVGDFVGDRMAKGLKDRLKANPDVVVVDKARGNTGLVRDDIYDWPQQMTALIEETSPKLVVVAVGMNDRQQLRTQNGRANKLSDAWRQEYESRVNTLIGNVTARKIPLIWLGLPPVRSRSMNADYLAMNEIIRTRVEAAGGRFVDIWDSFTDADGNYRNAGPDVNGQIVRLRLNDGINFTHAGRDMLAYYVERSMRSTIGIGSPAMVSIPKGGLVPGTTRPASNAAVSGKTALMSLDDVNLDGGGQLAGAGEFVKRQDDVLKSSTGYDLVVKGIATKPQPGRVDAGWGEATAPQSR